MILFAIATVFIRWWLPALAPFAFYVWYVLEWLIRLFMRGNAYRNISFEREAYANEANPEYLKNMKWGSWLKYL